MTTPKVEDVSQTAAELIRKKNRKYRRDYVECKADQQQFEAEAAEAQQKQAEYESWAKQFLAQREVPLEKVDPNIKSIPDILRTYHWDGREQKPYEVLHSLEIGDLLDVSEPVVGFVDCENVVYKRYILRAYRLLAKPLKDIAKVWKPCDKFKSYEVVYEVDTKLATPQPMPNAGRVCFRYGQAPIPLMIYYEKGNQLWVKDDKGNHSVVSLNDVRFVDQQSVQQVPTSTSVIDSALDSLYK